MGVGVSVGGGRHPSWAGAGCHENPHPPDADAATAAAAAVTAAQRSRRPPHGSVRPSRSHCCPRGLQITCKTKHRPRHESRGRLGSDWDLAAKTMRWIGR